MSAGSSACGCYFFLTPPPPIFDVAAPSPPLTGLLSSLFPQTARCCRTAARMYSVAAPLRRLNRESTARSSSERRGGASLVAFVVVDATPGLKISLIHRDAWRLVAGDIGRRRHRSVSRRKASRRCESERERERTDERVSQRSRGRVNENIADERAASVPSRTNLDDVYDVDALVVFDSRECAFRSALTRPADEDARSPTCVCVCV